MLAVKRLKSQIISVFGSH